MKEKTCHFSSFTRFYQQAKLLVTSETICWSSLIKKLVPSLANSIFVRQGFPTWSTCTPRGSFEVSNRRGKDICRFFISKYSKIQMFS